MLAGCNVGLKTNNGSNGNAAGTGRGDQSGGGRGMPPLMTAAGRGYLEVVRLLLARDVDLDIQDPDTGGTAFHYACVGNWPECAEVVVRAGCDVSIKDKYGHTGRETAELKGHTAVVERLRAVALGEQVRKTPSWPRSWANFSLF